MGAVHKIKKDKFIRKEFLRNEIKGIRLKYLIFNNYNKEIFRYYVSYKFQNHFLLRSSISRVCNRCVLVGRSRWILRRFKMCRMVFRLNAENDKLNGVRYSNW